MELAVKSFTQSKIIIWCQVIDGVSVIPAYRPFSDPFDLQSLEEMCPAWRVG